MTDGTETGGRNVEEEEPFEGLLVFKGPEWIRNLLHGRRTSNSE